MKSQFEIYYMQILETKLRLNMHVKKTIQLLTLHATFLFCYSAALFTFEKISVLTFILIYICMIYMIDVNICLSPTVIRKYLWFNIHMDSYLPITF